MQAHQVNAGLHAFRYEPRAYAPVEAQGVRLPARPEQRGHPELGEIFVQRILLAQFGKLGEQNGESFEFGSETMSEGTVRSAAVLAALFQPESLDGRLPLIGIEEPEIALHPAAAGVLFDALTEASEHVQVITTSQSADLLDREDLDPAIIRPVAMRDGVTIIGEVDDASREIAKEKLYTLGELMRGNQLLPQASQEATPDA